MALPDHLTDILFRTPCVQTLMLCPQCQTDTRGCLTVPCRAVPRTLACDTGTSCPPALPAQLFLVREPPLDPSGQAANKMGPFYLPPAVQDRGEEK